MTLFVLFATVRTIFPSMLVFLRSRTTTRYLVSFMYSILKENENVYSCRQKRSLVSTERCTIVNEKEGVAAKQPEGRIL